jgi:hypothetical protein
MCNLNNASLPDVAFRLSNMVTMDCADGGRISSIVEGCAGRCRGGVDCDTLSL